MKDWTRTPTDWADDPAVHAMADDLRVDAAQVTGHLLNIWSVLPAHARDGNLRTVPASLVEQWARWRGKRGAFSAALTLHVLDSEGLWVLWEDLNGAVLREKDSDRRRAADRRQAQKEERERQLDLMLAKSAGQSVGPSGVPSAATNERNGPTAVSAHARRNGNGVAYVPGHANVPASRFCEHCVGELRPVPGRKRPVLHHTADCPHSAGLALAASPAHQEQANGR